MLAIGGDQALFAGAWKTRTRPPSAAVSRAYPSCIVVAPQVFTWPRWEAVSLICTAAPYVMEPCAVQTLTPSVRTRPLLPDLIVSAVTPIVPATPPLAVGG